jgi:bifunctional DNase/RNase
MVEMSVETVSRARNRALIAVLRERGGRRVIGVGLSRPGAAAVQCGLRRIVPVRPLLWRALLHTVDVLGGSLVRTVIDRDAESRPCAFFDVLTPARGVIELPCSTEDAVALASLAQVPLWVGDSLVGRRRPWSGTA